MNRDLLVSRIARSSAPSPAGDQLELLTALGRIYDEMGLLPAGRSPALHRVCPHASVCWRGVPTNQRPSGVGRVDPESEKGCIVLPWVGPAYRTGGVCILGMNLRFGGEDWELGMEHRIARDPSSGQEPSLRAGRRAHGSYWATATMRDALALIRAGRGDEPLDEKRGDALADTLLEVARLQAVKCSPVGGRSSPTGAMATECPPVFLERELAVLRPSAVLAYGRPAHLALGLVGALDVGSLQDGFRRGTLTRKDGGSTTVFLLTHPAHPGWHAAHRRLVRSLRDGSLTG